MQTLPEHVGRYQRDAPVRDVKVLAVRFGIDAHAQSRRNARAFVDDHAMQHRAAWLVENRQFPVDTSGRRYPWPLV